MNSLIEQYPDTLWDIRPIPEGTLLRDWMEDGVRHLILRSTGSMCVYLGIPDTHPLAGFSYDDLTVACHGGLTFSNQGNGIRWPQGYWWYGYDYGHVGDASLFADPKVQAIVSLHDDDKRWTIKEVVEGTWWPRNDLVKLMRLAESITTHAKAGR